MENGSNNFPIRHNSIGLGQYFRRESRAHLSDGNSLDGIRPHHDKNQINNQIPKRDSVDDKTALRLPYKHVKEVVYYRRPNYAISDELHISDAQTLIKNHCPPFEEPKKLNSFSLDRNLTVICNDCQISYYIPPMLPVDLNIGLDIYENKPVDYHPFIAPLALAMEDRYNKNKTKPNSNEADIQLYKKSILSWRGLISTIVSTPFNRNKEWAFAAALVDGTIVLDELTIEDTLESRESQNTIMNQRFCYMGYKFEQYCTTLNFKDALHKKSHLRHTLDNIPVNSCEAYCVLFKSKLGEHNLVMAGEQDCIIADLDLKKDETSMRGYIELKTSKEIENNERAENTFFRFKLGKIWAQSFLAGVPRIIVGFRDDKGIVNRIFRYRTHEIPKLLEKKNNIHVRAGLVFADMLFKKMKEIIKLDYNEAVYLFRYDAKGRRVTIEVDKSGSRNKFAEPYAKFINGK